MPANELERAMAEVEAGTRPAPGYVRLDVAELMAIHRAMPASQAKALTLAALDFMALGIEPEFTGKERTAASHWIVLRAGFERRRRAALNGARNGGGGNVENPKSARQTRDKPAKNPRQTDLSGVDKGPDKSSQHAHQPAGTQNLGATQTPTQTPELLAISDKGEASQTRGASPDATRSASGGGEPSEGFQVVGPLTAQNARHLASRLGPEDARRFREFRRIHATLADGWPLDVFDARQRAMYAEHEAEWGLWADALARED